jgi:plastocyanin
MRAPVAVAALLVLLAAACGGDDPVDPGNNPRVDIQMQDNSFSPATRHVTVGQTVRWTNNGTRQHNTRRTQTPEMWTSDNLATGGVFEHTFSTTGTFTYSCTLHSGMNGTITVILVD